ncbi:MAG: sulfatase-like hydrolase/transferase, partial [Actinomycetota bacterium]
IQDEPVGWDFWRGTSVGSSSGYYEYKVNEDGIVRTVGSQDPDYHTTVLAGYADTFIRTTDPNTPLFLQVNTYAPHSPYTAETKYASDPRCATVTNTDNPAFNEADVSDKPTYIRTRSTVGTQAGVETPRAQCRTLLSVDDLIGTVLDALGDTGRLGNTFIIYMSDNGHMNGEHRWGAKWVPYEGSIRVPLVVRYDPMTGGVGRTDGHLVANIDIAPTLVDFAGISVTPGCPLPFYGGVCTGEFDGVSFLPILDGTAAPSRQDVLIEQKSDTSPSFYVPPYCGVRTQMYKYVRYTTGEEELYDLVADPWELVNMLGDGTITSQDQALRDQMFARLFGAGGLCHPPPPTYQLP